MKTFNLIFLFVFFIFSKNRTTLNNDKTDVVNFNIENTVNNDFNGTWNYEFNSEENELLNKSGDEADLSNRSLIRIHGGRQEGVPKPKLLRTSGCIRVLDSDAKILYDYP